MIVKLADGGNKKKTPQALTIPTKIWADATRDVSYLFCQGEITLDKKDFIEIILE